MGNVKSGHPSERVTRRSDFQFKYIIGRGGFGRVWKVKHRQTKQKLALKQMSKARIINRRSVVSVLNERKLLSVLKHPFIVNMQVAFQDSENLYLVMDLVTGGDLRYHLNSRGSFTENETRFFTACVITGLEYLHLNKIIHRDIKPENLMLDSKGYLRITDFGIAHAISTENNRCTSGTPGYMAPEVLCRQHQSVGVDYFSLGVTVYELMTGKRPYSAKDRYELRDTMLSQQVQLKKSDVPEGWGMDGVDFINKLLQRKQTNRLGFRGPSELKKHAWFRGFPWKRLLEKSLEAPYKPTLKHNFEKARLNVFDSETEFFITDQSLLKLFEHYTSKRSSFKENDNRDLSHSQINR